MKLRVFLVLIALSLEAACLPISKETPEKQQFVLDVSRPTGVRSKPLNAFLRVNEFRLSQRYEGRGLTYRVDDLTYKSDYYNEFFILPGQMIAEETIQWLDESDLFQDVAGDSLNQEPSYFLDGTIQELYGDYFANPAKAVLEIEFVLLKRVKGSDQIFFKKAYRQEQPASGKSAKELVKAWNEALFSILKTLEEDLRRKLTTAVSG
jgi:uncharacterized lipoprotein YmbA